MTTFKSLCEAEIFIRNIENSSESEIKSRFSYTPHFPLTHYSLSPNFPIQQFPILIQVKKKWAAGDVVELSRTGL